MVLTLGGSRRRRRGAATALAVTALVATSLAVAAPGSAAPSDPFDAGNIISDERFFDADAMDVAEVQSFLNAQVPTCAAGSEPCLKSYRESTPTLAADAYCARYSGGSGRTAAQIIVGVATACGINPQVLLVLLEKEQGLVGSTSPTSRMYRSATGYGCPDTADCDSEYYGFFNQVYNAAHQFQRYTATSSSWRYRPGRWNAIRYHPDASCGSSDVYIRNQATANLYIYTPYQPNAAALANPYGVGDACSSYGNRNFWRIFRDWFGNPSNWLTSASFEGSTAGWSASNGFINRQLARDSRAHDGEWFLAVNTSVRGRALSQTVTRTTRIGERIAVSIWVRSSSATRTYTGKLVAWALGGTKESSGTSFTVGDEWTLVTTELDVTASTHDRVRLDLYLASTDATLWVDGAELGFSPSPPPKNRLGNASFETGLSPWYPGNGAVNLLVASDTRAYDGSRFLATNTAVRGRSLAQSVLTEVESGETLTFSVRTRAAGRGSAFSGKLVLWVIGPSGKRAGTESFTAVDEWGTVTTSVSAPATESVRLKAELYLGTTGTTLWIDDAMLSPERLANGSFENGTQAWSRSDDTVNLVSYSTSATGIDAPDGARFAQANTTTSGASVSSEALVDVEAEEEYRGSLWIRTASSSDSFRGRLALWALGGEEAEVAVSDIDVDGEWRQIVVDLPVRRDGHTSLRLELYLDTPGVTVRMDDAHLF